MYRGFLTILFIAVVIAVSIQKAMAIKCWRCSSDAANANFCNDPFEPLNRNFVYVECSEKEDGKSVCKKEKKIVNGQSVIIRSCHWEKRGDLRNECFKNSVNMTSSSTTEFCETCGTDGCNNAIQHHLTLILVLLPVCVSKISFILKSH